MIRRLPLLLLLFAQPAWAVDHYISPTGTDSGSCTTAGSPCRTFAYALAAARMPAGDRLILKNGTYSPGAGTGLPNINCSSGYNDGTAANPITVIAENERQAFIQNTTAPNTLPFAMNNCSYWNIEGLRIEGADISGVSIEFHIVSVLNSDHITLRRLLVARNNRYTNGHGVYLDATTSSLLEENEVYHFHRHGFLIRNGSTTPGLNVLRRNYADSRGHADIPGGFGTSGIDGARGDTAFMIYPSSDNIIENNIAVDVGAGGFEAISVGGATGASNRNRFLGNIALKSRTGIVPASFGSEFGLPASADNVVENFVWVDGRVTVSEFGPGITSHGPRNTVTNASLLNHDGDFSVGVELAGYGGQSDPDASFSCTNCLVSNVTRGFNVITSEHPDFLFNYPNVFVPGTAFSPAASDSRITNESTVNPQLGNCKAWIPDSSPMKGAGLSGADIGANVLYKYVNGVLTGDPLWNITTNDFLGCGAIVAGVNDTAGNSCSNVDIRLNIGSANGCAFPAGYDAPACSDTLDNDGDGLTDYPSDTGCTGTSDSDESGSPSTITLGQTGILPTSGQTNDFLIAYSATLSQSGTIQTFSFYVTTAAGSLRLGIYDDSGPSGGPGTKLAETNSITPIVGWNTANVVTPVLLSPDTYWLAYVNSNSSFSFRKTSSAGLSARFYSFTFGTLPTTFSASPGSSTENWSFYATLTLVAPTLTIASPSGGAYLPGRALPITWTTSGFGADTITIRLTRNNGTTWENIVVGTANDSSYDWNVATPSSSNCKIELCGVTNSTICDTSDSAFRIRGIHIAGLSP